MPLPEKEGNETERFEEMGLKCQRFKALPIYRGTILRHDTRLGAEAAARIETLHQQKAKIENSASRSGTGVSGDHRSRAEIERVTFMGNCP